jgi:hypothetical protein
MKERPPLETADNEQDTGKNEVWFFGVEHNSLDALGSTCQCMVSCASITTGHGRVGFVVIREDTLVSSNLESNPVKESNDPMPANNFINGLIKRGWNVSQ